MNSIRTWYLRNQTEITWFIIGWLALAALYDLSSGDWVGLTIDVALIVANLALSKS